AAADIDKTQYGAEQTIKFLAATLIGVGSARVVDGKAGDGPAVQQDGVALGRSEISDGGFASQNGGSGLSIRDYYSHHQDMVDDVKDELRARGYNVSDKEVSFGNSCAAGRCR